MGKLTGKVAIVTGASRGIGRGIAFALGREGAKLVLNSRDPDRLETGIDQDERKVFARIEHLALHGGERNADDLAHLGDGLVLIVEQLDDFAMGRRQLAARRKIEQGIGKGGTPHAAALRAPLRASINAA